MKEGNLKGHRRKGRKSNKKMKEQLEMLKKHSKSSILGIEEDVISENNKEQYLFLLEFCIQRITGKRLAKLNQMFFVPTSVGLEFLHFTEEDNIEITPVDLLFEPQAGIADDIEYFYSGKSVMFAMDHETTKNKSLEFTVKMTIRKRMPEGIRPDILVGVAEFELTKQFAALRKEMLQCWHRKIPPAKTFEDSIPLIMNEKQVGEVLLYVRMSAFGETIVTEFQSPELIKNGSTYVFKGEELNDQFLAYKCRMVDSENVQAQESSIIDVPCRACVLEEYNCLPCGRSTGARAKDQIQSDDRKSLCLSEVYKPASYPASILEDKSKKDFCNDISKPAGPIQTSRGPVQACGKAVILKVSGLLNAEANKQPTVTVSPECDTTGPDCSPNSEHDVFILRIGKKGLVGADEKSDLQLEMRTPKGPERRPPIRYETRQIQADIEEKKKKAKKGKKKKKK
ncbi:PREDICTED: uncharacterized protein LOC107070396 [Polistes dominula]|uniref:Uncharacterized protein LOC107070396 n=1 Tax=Polistes dominula TaxID=743375 RepID=A0ABM1IV08_POLDO|nr:PREDICTED: uncharacterized protein LOC107070396 [Polistes dominula]